MTERTLTIGGAYAERQRIPRDHREIVSFMMHDPKEVGPDRIGWSTYVLGARARGFPVQSEEKARRERIARMTGLR